MSANPQLDRQIESGLERGIEKVVRAMRARCAAYLRSDDALLSALDHHLAGGGGRARIRLALHAGTALGLAEDDAVAIAASVETLHNASLVQDDLQDADAWRRGRPSVWKQFGQNTAIALTDLLISASYGSLAEISDHGRIPALVSRLHRAISVTLRGQNADLVRDHESPPELSDYLTVAREKSGNLFALALELPMIASGHEADLPAAHQAACWFGTGYQIFDDLDDVEVDSRSGARMNAVLILEVRSERDRAAAEARLLARGHLRSASALADTLPSGSGAFLAALSRSLEARLEGRGRV